MKIMVVGPTQSGKTCLAVGLANSTNDEIVVIPRGDGQYLRERAKEFAESKWPAGTKERKSLRFVFKWNEKPDDTIIDDYIGESWTSTEFLEDMSKLGKDDGVVLLVNPGFDCPYIDESGKTRMATDEDKKAKKKILYANAFKDNRPFARQWLIDQEGKYEQIIEWLRTKRNGESKGNDLPVVAVVVTASDRLEPNGDLYDGSEHFNAFLDKVTNRLTGFEHETFRVSVTGHLEDQNKPTLASGKENTSYRPFRWVLEKLAERKEEKIKGDQRELKNWRKSVLIIASAVAAFAGLCIGTFKWVDAVRDQEDIATWTSAIVNSLGKTSLRCGDIKKAADNLNCLRTHNGFHAAEAVRAADKWEPEIWKKQESLISQSILEMSGSQGSKGGVKDVAEVDDLFSAFKPTMANVVAEYDKVYANWELKKVELEELHNEHEFRENVERPLRAAEMFHGRSAMDKLYPITDTISRLKPSTERLNLAKEELARKVDGRIEDEWRNFAIRGFEKTASTNATTKAVVDFQARLDDWTPVSSSGVVAKSNLVAFVSAKVPAWRTQYEKTKFISEADKAVKANSMEEMAKFYPGRVATNEFLAVEFAEKQWNDRIKPVFEREYKVYLDGIVVKSSNGRDRPTIADDKKNDIKRRATIVGAPFDEDDALKYVEERVAAKSDNWETAKREECEKWIREKIRPGRSRTDSKGLWSEYEKDAKDPIRQTNPLFVEIVGAAVYREVEKWFESDVAAFKKELSPAEGVSLWLDDSNFEVRYKGLVNTFEEFKKTCRRINEDRNPPAGTWARRFAELCVTKGGIENGGVNKVFGQRIVAKQLDAQIDYQKNYPVNYKCTAFAAWFEVESFESKGTPMKGDDNLPNPQLISLIDADGENAPKNETTSISKEFDGEFKTIWSDEKILEAGLFQRTKFVVKATDYNGNHIKKTSDIKKVISFVDKQRTLELDGQLHIGRFTGVKDADIKVRLSVDISGETPFSLLEQAKREIRERGDAK